MSYKPQLLAIPAEVWDIALGWEKTKLVSPRFLTTPH